MSDLPEMDSRAVGKNVRSINSLIASIAILTSFFLLMSVFENRAIRTRLQQTEMAVAIYYSEKEACKVELQKRPNLIKGRGAVAGYQMETGQE